MQNQENQLEIPQRKIKGLSRKSYQLSKDQKKEKKNIEEIQKIKSWKNKLSQLYDYDYLLSKSQTHIHELKTIKTLKISKETVYND